MSNIESFRDAIIDLKNLLSEEEVSVTAARGLRSTTARRGTRGRAEPVPKQLQFIIPSFNAASIRKAFFDNKLLGQFQDAIAYLLVANLKPGLLDKEQTEMFKTYVRAQVYQGRTAFTYLAKLVNDIMDVSSKAGKQPGEPEAPEEAPTGRP